MKYMRSVVINSQINVAELLDFLLPSKLGLMPLSDRDLGASVVRALLEFADYALYATDLASAIVLWNPAAGRLYGFSAEEAVGRPISELLQFENSEEELRILERLSGHT